MSRQEFSSLISETCPELPETVRQTIVNFRELVCLENESQNLTRLLSPLDFLDGHVIDSIELVKSGLVRFPAMDLGSGAGVPGLLCAILDPKSDWILTESEKKKASFLVETVKRLGVTNVRVFADRAEVFLRSKTVESVVSRAVGPVDRIYGWLRPRSTWNTLVLMKGPSWLEEWAKFQSGPYNKELLVDGEHEYEVGAEKKRRRIVRLRRTRSG